MWKRSKSRQLGCPLRSGHDEMKSEPQTAPQGEEEYLFWSGTDPRVGWRTILGRHINISHALVLFYEVLGSGCTA